MFFCQFIHCLLVLHLSLLSPCQPNNDASVDVHYCEYPINTCSIVHHTYMTTANFTVASDLTFHSQTHISHQQYHLGALLVCPLGAFLGMPVETVSVGQEPSAVQYGPGQNTHMYKDKVGNLSSKTSRTIFFLS